MKFWINNIAFFIKFYENYINLMKSFNNWVPVTYHKSKVKHAAITGREFSHTPKFYWVLAGISLLLV